jgi:hypothetical protein
VGDDAEYYMEQQEEEARFRQACEYAALDRNKKRIRKPLLCWTDGDAEEIWDWEPLTKILDVFSDLHNVSQIGSDCFLSSGIPAEDDDEDWDDEYTSPIETFDSSKIKLIDDLEFYVANSEDEATYEVIILSRHDAALLKDEAVQRKNSAKTLKEEMLAEMLEEMVLFIEADSLRNDFVFARKL